MDNKSVDKMTKINALAAADDDYGPGQCFASVHVQLEPEESAVACHNIIDTIERRALAELNVHLVIHFDPENDEE